MYFTVWLWTSSVDEMHIHCSKWFKILLVLGLVFSSCCVCIFVLKLHNFLFKAFHTECLPPVLFNFNYFSLFEIIKRTGTFLWKGKIIHLLDLYLQISINCDVLKTSIKIMFLLTCYNFPFCVTVFYMKNRVMNSLQENQRWAIATLSPRLEQSMCSVNETPYHLTSLLSSSLPQSSSLA